MSHGLKAEVRMSFGPTDMHTVSKSTTHVDKITWNWTSQTLLLCFHVTKRGFYPESGLQQQPASFTVNSEAAPEVPLRP